LAKKKKIEETPLMKQYFQIKAKYPDALLLFRVGDFYETFGEDAVKTAKTLGIILTSRANGSSNVELAGFPHHSLDTYLPKLVKSGFRVAICEQLEDPKKTKKIVKRGVTELVTPGTSTNDKLLEHKENNYLASVHFNKDIIGISFLDLSTGDFLTTEGNQTYISNLISTFNPSEILLSKAKVKDFNTKLNLNKHTFLLEDWLFSYDYTYEKLTNHFQTKNLKGFGIEELSSAISSAGVILHYLYENKHDRINHINKISRIDKNEYVWIDRFSIKNLELLGTIQGSGSSLVEVIDKTQTPMGGRMLKKWVLMPLLNIQRIKERQETVSYFIKNQSLSEEISELLAQVGDLERLISKAALFKISPREVKYLHQALDLVHKLKKLLRKENSELFDKLIDNLNTCDTLVQKIDRILVEDAPVQVNKGDMIKSGVSEELDEYKNIKKSGKDYILKIKEREVLNTGISSLKIGFNNVFGYYLEVTNKYKNQVPESWTRKQTLTNAERYITEELKGYEEKILNAEEKIIELEIEIYQSLLNDIQDYIQPVQQNSKIISFIDCLLSFSVHALENNYCKPEVDDSLILDIKEGRHPVIEKNLPANQKYIPNDIYLNNSNQQIIILTGPNMSGKSAILRQTALISILAQIGSFVPAKEARIGITDKIFTRVGASDNLSVGESTFMVEMLETASIINNLSERSLVLLDEIGRGTSTYDGVSIAWAITEFLHQNTLKPKTIFATHYHELNELAQTHKRIRNFNVSVKEYGNKVIFLRKIKPGGSEHSFGIHVAQMAGIPKKITERAKLILEELEKQRNNIKNERDGTAGPVDIQLKMFEVTDPIYERVKKELNKIDVNAITPIEALMKLNHLKGLLKKDL
jgi:DNA mismatch repair protein MutS